MFQMNKFQATIVRMDHVTNEKCHIVGMNIHDRHDQWKSVFSNHGLDLQL